MRKIALRFNRLLLFVSITMMAADKPAFLPKPASEYPHKQTSEKVTIAIEPYTTDVKAAEAFGKLNPWRYGVVPVLVVIQNDGPEAVKIEKIKFVYMLPDRTRITATPASDVKYAVGPNRPQMGAPIPTRVIIKNKKNPLDVPEIESRALVTRMVPPGQSISGFVYFQTDVDSAASTITISGLSNAASNQALYDFEIPLSGN